MSTAMRMAVYSSAKIYSPHSRSCSVLPSEALIVRLVDLLKLAVPSMPVNRSIPLTCVSGFGTIYRIGMMGGLRLANRLHRHVSGEEWSCSCETVKSENNKPLPLPWECSNNVNFERGAEPPPLEAQARSAGVDRFIKSYNFDFFLDPFLGGMRIAHPSAEPQNSIVPSVRHLQLLRPNPTDRNHLAS